MRFPQLFSTALSVLAAAAIAPRPAAAWAPATQRAIARAAARLAPPELARLLERNAQALEAGALEPFGERDARRHMKNEDGSGLLDRVALAETSAAVAGLRARLAGAEIARRFGRVSHFVADADNPLNASARDPEEPLYFRDYLLYAESARPRFALVVYRSSALPRGTAPLARTIAEALARGREEYPLLGREYRRVGFASGRLAFDDRSTAFAVAALAYSHAVTDVATFFRAAWAESRGGAAPFTTRSAAATGAAVAEVAR